MSDDQPPRTVGFVGRTRECDQTMAAIEQGRNVLVVGRTGSGKTALLRHLWEHYRTRHEVGELDHAPMWIPPGTTKETMVKIARQIHQNPGMGLILPESLIPPQTLTRAKRQGHLPWSDVYRCLHRASKELQLGIITESLSDYTTRSGNKALVFIDSLEVPPSQANAFRDLLEHAQVVAGMDRKNRRARIEKLLWKFHTTLDLRPLTLEDCEELVGQWLALHPLRFSSDQVRRKFIRHLAQESHGNPEALYGMLTAAAQEEEINPGKLMDMSHPAGREYLDLTPVLLVGLVLFFALRYIGRGLSDMELSVLAGIGMALFILLRMVYAKLRKPP